MESFNELFSNILFSLGPIAREVFIFFLGYIEGLPIIGSLVPGGTMAILIGTLSKDGYIAPLLAINLIALGSFLGDLTGFVFGKQLRKLDYVKRMMENEKNKKHWDLFDRHIALVIIIGKVLPVVRSTPSLFAGMRKIPLHRYAIYTLIGSYLWAVIGIYSGSALANILGDYAVPIIILTVFVLTFGSFTYNKIKKYQREKRKIKEAVE
jgi:membrane-associated protein